MEERKITMHGNPLTLVGKAIQVGENAPVFYGLGKKLEPISLEEFPVKMR